MDLKVSFEDPTLAPEQMHIEDAGLDLKTSCDIDLRSHCQMTIFTGVKVEVPHNYIGLVVIRSGLARKYGLSLVSSFGIIDSRYRGEICLSLINHGDFTFTASKGDRIAQLLIIPCELPDVILVNEQEVAERGEKCVLGSVGNDAA
jgi:dUTP pyrophosphatase